VGRRGRGDGAVIRRGELSRRRAIDHGIDSGTEIGINGRASEARDARSQRACRSDPNSKNLSPLLLRPPEADGNDQVSGIVTDTACIIVELANLLRIQTNTCTMPPREPHPPTSARSVPTSRSTPGPPAATPHAAAGGHEWSGISLTCSGRDRLGCLGLVCLQLGAESIRPDAATLEAASD
jgi:hypothetical protein